MTVLGYRQPEDHSHRGAIWLAAMFAVAAIALGRALQLRDGLYHPPAILWMTIALAAALAPFIWRHGPAWIDESRLALVLAVGLAFNFVQLFTDRPGSEWAMGHGVHPDLWFYVLLAPAAALVAAGLTNFAPLRRWWFGLLLATYVGLGAWMIRSVPTPYIDVYVVQEESCRALLAGRNPYSIDFPDIYKGTSHTYTPGMLAGERTSFGYVYMPVTLLLALPGHVLGGDYRWSHLAMMSLAGAMIAYARPSHLAMLAAALLLFTPRSLVFIEQGWTDAVTIFLLSAVGFVAVRRPRALPYVLGLFLASKQYLPLTLPLLLLLMPRPWSVRAAWAMLWRAALVALAITLPMALWDARGFIENAMLLQFRAPFRNDALSYLAWVANRWSIQLPPTLGLGALLGAMALALWRLRPSAGAFAAAMALAYFGFFALNKQAFCNYYMFVIAAFCLAIATYDASPTPAEGGEAKRDGSQAGQAGAVANG